MWKWSYIVYLLQAIVYEEGWLCITGTNSRTPQESEITVYGKISVRAPSCCIGLHGD